MGGAKPWQIVILVLGLIGLGVGVWYSVAGGPQRVELSKTVFLGDFKSGEIFEVYVGNKAVLAPAKHPQSGARTLVPVYQDPTSKAWRIEGRYLGVLDEYAKAASVTADAVGDRRSGELKASNPTPQKVDIEKVL